MVSSQAHSNDNDPSKKLFHSTFWEPQKGVKLLKQESAQKTWHKYEKACSLPDFDHSDFPVISYYVFKTEHHVIFVYNKQMNVGEYWTICDKDTKTNLFESKNYASGYDVLEDGSLDTHGPCSDYRAGYTNIRFRPYAKDQLMLEMNLRVCQRNENHHEFLFHLDEPGLNEVEGSRFMLADDVHGPLLYWKYHGKSYSQLGKSSLNEDGERTWSRKLEAVIRNVDSKHPVWEFHCKYSNASRAVECTESLVQRVELDSLLSKSESCNELETKWRSLPEVEKRGFTVTAKARLRLKSERENKCSGISP